MVGGIIKDFFIKEKKDTHFIVKFLVREAVGEEYTGSWCTVMAEIPVDAVKFKMIEAGQAIWWHNPWVLIKIEETEDVKFKKIGYSGGDFDSFQLEKQNTQPQEDAGR